ncbi:MAG: hypothetical protein AB7W16_16370 [Candidatus Obscuribacterales bacterium]
MLWIVSKFAILGTILRAAKIAAIVFVMVLQVCSITVLGSCFKGSSRGFWQSMDVVEPLPGEFVPGCTRQERVVRAALVPVPRASVPMSPAFVPAPEPSIPETATSPGRAPLLRNPSSWPPAANRHYPDMELVNQDGKLTRLSDLTGNVIIIQPVAMSCPLTQAYSGANREGVGPYRLCFPPGNVRDVASLVTELSGVKMSRPDLIFVQIVFYNWRGEAPSVDEIRDWADHFDLRTSRNQYVLAATPDMVCRASKLMIPGFQLVDRSFVLRSDSAGIMPKDSLYNHFLPTLRALFP